MEFNELIESMKSFEGTEDYENYVNGFVTSDRVSKFLDTEDGKKILEPLYHSHFSKSLETWKTNNLSKLVDEEYKKRFPDADPKDTEIAKLKADFEALKAESVRKDLTNKALTIATEKKLPIELVDFFVGEDETATTDNLNKFETAFNAALEKMVTAKLGQSHKPDAGDDSKGFDPTKLDGLTIDEINKQVNQMKK